MHDACRSGACFYGTRVRAVTIYSPPPARPRRVEGGQGPVRARRDGPPRSPNWANWPPPSATPQAARAQAHSLASRARPAGSRGGPRAPLQEGRRPTCGSGADSLTPTARARTDGPSEARVACLRRGPESGRTRARRERAWRPAEALLRPRPPSPGASCRKRPAGTDRDRGQGVVRPLQLLLCAAPTQTDEFFFGRLGYYYFAFAELARTGVAGAWRGALYPSPSRLVADRRHPYAPRWLHTMARKRARPAGRRARYAHARRVRTVVSVSTYREMTGS